MAELTSNEGKNLTIEVDGEISNLLIETLSILPNIIHVVLIRAV